MCEVLGLKNKSFIVWQIIKFSFLKSQNLKTWLIVSVCCQQNCIAEPQVIHWLLHSNRIYAVQIYSSDYMVDKTVLYIQISVLKMELLVGFHHIVESDPCCEILFKENQNEYSVSICK